MRVSLIAAVAENGVIGKDNDLVWKLPDDMRFFSQMTRGHHVLMGRRNFESIPAKYRPLPGRPNVVISRNGDYDAEGSLVVSSIEAGLALARQAGETESFIIGGGQIYRAALESGIAEYQYITHVHGSPDGDTFYPKFDANDWRKTILSEHAADDRHAMAFTICKYDRR